MLAIIMANHLVDLIDILNGTFLKENTVVLKMCNKVNSVVKEGCKYVSIYKCLLCLHHSLLCVVEVGVVMMMLVVVVVVVKVDISPGGFIWIK